jgi:hypothetical protein
MPTSFYSITSHLMALFAQAPAVSANIYRARDRNIPAENLTALNVQFDGASPMSMAIKGAPIDWMSKFSIDCYAKSKSVEGDEAVDPLLSAVFARIAADTTLGGLVVDVGVPFVETEYSAEGFRTGWVRLTYPVQHRTQNSTLE